MIKIYILVGYYEKAIKKLEELIKNKNLIFDVLHLGELMVDPEWAPLNKYENERFQSILKKLSNRVIEGIK